MAPALALSTALEYLAAARLETDSRERNALLDLAGHYVRQVLADYTPVQPLARREELRKSSAHFKAASLELAEGRATAGVATPPRGIAK